MPQVSMDPQDYILQQIALLKQQMQALATQQQFVVVDGTLTRRVALGLQDDGTYGFESFDNTGNKVVSVGQGSDGAYGLESFDSTGQERVQIGQLNSGDYGLAVTDSTGLVTTEILPVYQAQVLTSQGTTSTTYTDLATVGPQVGAVIGASGQAWITCGSYIGIPGSTGGSQSAGVVGISVDGGAPSGIYDGALELSNTVTGPNAIGIACTNATSFVATGLSPGIHNFELKYYMIGPGTVNFESRFIQVRPL